MNKYTCLNGQEFDVDLLTKEEKVEIEKLQYIANEATDWAIFNNLWMNTVFNFYDSSSLTRPQIRQTALYRIGQDLSSRLAIFHGLALPPKEVKV